MKTIIASPTIGKDFWMIYQTQYFFGTYVYAPGLAPPVKICASLN